MGSGRTDAGVHATGQVASIFCKTKMSPLQIKRALNSKLSADIFIKDCVVVNEEFNARFSAKKRKYIYFFTNNPPTTQFQTEEHAENII